MAGFSRSGTSVDQLLRMGIENARQGNRDGARVMLRQVLDQDKRNDVALMWLAYIEEDPVQRQRFLESAVKANPGNKKAQAALEKITTRHERSANQTMRYGIIAVGGMVIFAILACLLVLAMS